MGLAATQRRTVNPRDKPILRWGHEVLGNFPEVAATVVLLATVPGCATGHHSASRVDVKNSGVEGQVAFQFVPDPGRLKPPLSDRQVFMPPRPLETPLPSYPESELVKNTGPVTVEVRIFVGTDGSID